MTRDQAVAFFLFSVAAAGTPGPSNVLLMATGAQVGVRRGLGCLLGVGLGMAVMMFVVAFGLGSVILGAPTLLRIMKWCGAAFLLWLACAAAFQWINPKSWIVCASAAATFLDRQAGSALGQSAALGLVFLAACLPSCLPWLAFGAAMQRTLRSPRAFRLFNGVMAALLAASVALFVR